MRAFVREAAASASTVTRYRTPLVGFADADDPRWLQLREWADPAHRLPADLLTGARTVAVYFLPFTEALVQANREAADVAPSWALAYRETNALLGRIAATLAEALEAKGIRAAGEPPTHNFDTATLACRWSHKSAAALAGLGSFGLHRLLITEAGCAGRFGSLVLDAFVPPSPPDPGGRCLSFSGGSCRVCVGRCPVTALEAAGPGADNLDKHRCYARLLEVERRLGANCCGKCALGPCALASPSSR